MMRLKMVGLVFCQLFWVGVALGQSGVDRESMDLTKFNQFFHYLNGIYVDTLNGNRMIEAAISGVLSKLDPHSAYISADEMKGVTESFEGSFEGIGIEFSILNDTLLVVNTISGGPAAKVGLSPNDRILEVDGRNVVGITQREVPKLLRGPKGSALEVLVHRRGVLEPLAFRIVRDKIPMNTVDAAYRVDDRTAYIRLNRFATTTNNEFEAALQKLGPVTNLIVDLRGNGGGFLDQAIRLSSQFLEPNSLVVFTEGRAFPTERYVSGAEGKFRKGHLVVLVDESSASASEIVSGAIQDWDRGLIVGRRTFGKGLVQRQIPLVDGSAVRITVSRYHTPTGRAIQRPFENGNVEQYYKDLMAQYRANVSHQDTLQQADAQKFYTLKNQRVVYGGGGVLPDIHVPLDTTEYTDYYGALIRKGVINQYTVDYMDKNREKMAKAYQTLADYRTNFEVSDEMLNGLVALAESQGVPRNNTELQQSTREIKRQIKAILAQKLWDMTAYFEIINASDPVFQKAVEVFGDWNRYGALLQKQSGL